MTTMTKHGLGRGLGALIPTPAPESQLQNSVRYVQIAHIEPNPRQPRKRFTPEALDQLAASLREHGMIQPLLLTEISTDHGARYQLIAGERRWRAAQRAGMTSVPAIIKGASPQQMIELALVENVQRADLNILEEAEAYSQLLRDFGLTQEQVAQLVGKDRVTVSNTLRLLKLPDALKDQVLNEAIREGHARALMQVNDPQKQNALLNQVVTKQLSIRQTEELVRRTLEKHPHARRPAPTRGGSFSRRTQAVAGSLLHLETQVLEEDLRSALGTKVELHRTQRGGKLVIEFYSDEEFEVIYNKLTAP